MNEFFNLKKIFDYFDYIFYFFSLNLLFLLINIPMILFFFFIGISNLFIYFPVFLLCLIPTGTGFTSLLYCMGKFIRNKTLSVMSDFIKGIKLNFEQSLFFWSLELLIVFILYSNIRFFSSVHYNLILNCIFISLLLLISLTTPYIYILMSRFSMKNLDLLKNALILTFTRPIITVCNILICIVSLILFEIIPGTMFLFIFSISTFLLSFTNKALLMELENLSAN